MSDSAVSASTITDSTMSDPTFLTRVRLQNYRSIASCNVPLGALRFLVGPNGSGKSNFVDALRLVAGKRGLPDDLAPPADPESIRDAKGWLRDRMPRGRKYRETLDQRAFAAIFDLETARRCRSFDRCCREIARLVETVEAKCPVDGAPPSGNA